MGIRRMLFAVCQLSVVLALLPVQLSAQTSYDVVADFNGSVATQAWGGVIKGSDGALYGTTAASDTPPWGCGTVYRVAPDGTFTVLHEFVHTDGCFPVGELVEGPDGNFYGTTSAGGPNSDLPNANRGTGTIFRISPSGDFVTTHAFAPFDQNTSTFPEGMYPFGTMALRTDGYLYGTANYGGARGCGTVFKVSLAGLLTVLHSFGESSTADGCDPNSGLSLGPDGNLYGTALADEGSGHAGSIYRVTPAGSFTVLGNLPVGTVCQCAPFGAGPLGEPVVDANGNVYGVAQTGGPGEVSTQLGTLWKLSATGELSLLHAFTGSDGANPSAGLTFGADGNLYGTTYGNSVDTSGTVFRVTPTGTFANLHVFDEAAGPDGRLLEKSAGVFIGTTQGGGAGGKGFVFAISVALPTTTSLGISPNPSTFGQLVTFTAHVTAGQGTPSGLVEFRDGTQSLGTAPLGAGTATLQTSALLPGVHSLTASYGGDTTFTQSASSAVSLSVTRAQTTTGITSAPNPSAKRQTAIFTVRVSPQSPGGGTPTGQVRLMSGKKTLGSASLVSGTATIAIKFTQGGQQVVTAAYGGDTRFLASTSAPYTQVVNR